MGKGALARILCRLQSMVGGFRDVDVGMRHLLRGLAVFMPFGGINFDARTLPCRIRNHGVSPTKPAGIEEAD